MKLRKDEIEAIGIDESGALWVRPATATFPYIYREAMDVHWDPQRHCLHGPEPRDWSHLAWFKRIRDAAREQGVMLTLGAHTFWSNIDPGLALDIRVAAAEE